MDSEDSLKRLIQVFSPQLEETLDPGDLLPYFPDWSQEWRESIMTKSTTAERARQFLFLLTSPEPFTSRHISEFRVALEKSGYKQLANLLAGDEFHDCGAFMKWLRIFEQDVEDHIVINGRLLNSLVVAGVITENNQEQISAKTTTRERLFVLMSCLPRRAPDWPAKFVTALKRAGNELVLSKLFDLDEEDDSAFATDQIRQKNEDLLRVCQPDCLRTLDNVPATADMELDENQIPQTTTGDSPSLSAEDQETAIKTPVSLDAKYREAADNLASGQPTNQSCIPNSKVLKDKELPMDGVDFPPPSQNNLVVDPKNEEMDNDLSSEAKTNSRNIDNTMSLELCFKSVAEEASDVMAAAPGGASASDKKVSDEPSSAPVSASAASDVPQTFTLRSYQEELARPGLAGKNSIVCAPTGSGKTHVALAITKNHLERAPRGGKERVIFAVDTVHLMDQQLNLFKPHLPADCNTTGMSGNSTETMVSLGQMMKESKVIVLTAQILLNALDTDTDCNHDIVSISDISLLIFDECHNTTKKHCYNQIMKYYLEEKLKNGPSEVLPQIIGLTASLGVGHASTIEEAVKHIEKVCANLDTAEISIVRENVEELSKYVAPPEMELIPVPTRKKDPCKLIISQQMERIHARLRAQPELYEMLDERKSQLDTLLKDIPQDFSSEAYTQWCAIFGQTVPLVHDLRLKKPFWTYHAHLQIYHDALLINAKVRTIDALEYMMDQMNNLQTQGMKDDLGEWLEETFTEICSQLRPITKDPDLENPLLAMLREKILAYSSQVDDCRGIIFVQTRAATERLKNWMEEDPDLNSLKPGVMIGTNEMTQNQQREMMKKFRDGKHKAIVATSVIENGLDVQMCNWVIKYLHTTNEITLVQAKGRARKVGSMFALIAAESSRKVEKEQLNILREEMMNQAVIEVSAMDRHSLAQRMRETQKEELLRHKSELQEKKQRPLLTDEYSIHCKKCEEFVSSSSDLRVYKKSHYTFIGADFNKAYITKPHPKRVKLADFEQIAKVHCKKCHQDWGTMTKLLGQELALLTPKGLLFVDVTKGERMTIRKWTELEYRVPEMDVVGEMLQMVD